VEDETDGVADAARVDLVAAAIEVHAHDRAVVLLRLADVARRAERHVQLVVRADDNVSPLMVAARLEAIAHHDRRGRILQPILDPVEADDPLHLGHVERAVVERDAVRLIEILDDRQHFVGAAIVIGVANSVDGARIALSGQLAERTDEQRAFRAERHRPRRRKALGIQGNREARRQTHRFELHRRRRAAAASASSSATTRSARTRTSGAAARRGSLALSLPLSWCGCGKERHDDGHHQCRQHLRSHRFNSWESTTRAPRLIIADCS
jgi:hypothetical protein